MLYEFYGLECPHCDKMRKLTDRLMQEYPDVHIERKEVWHDEHNMKFIEELDKGDACGGTVGVNKPAAQINCLPIDLGE